ncbi:MAG: hypothetical protein J6L47_00590 [Alphaproteobacteria bacterium]|nr:hypothetical protein [Alphaproteobacteria bacterium]
MPNLNVGLGVVLGTCQTAQAISTTTCWSKSICTAQIYSGCCCPGGTTGTIYNCPSGWTWDSTSKLCTRSATSGTDDDGTYTQSYGTCSYTSTSTYECYLQTNYKTSDECYCIGNVAEM